MRRIFFLALVVASASSCQHGPDLACVTECELQNDSCMMQASDSNAVQRCDDSLGRCLTFCR